MILDNPLGAVVIAGSNGLTASHIPFELVPEPTPLGRLRGHVARANPLWDQVLSNTEALVIFQGASSYISPSWYPSKHAHGEAVPTWNYVAAHAYGRIRVFNDSDWLRAHIERLTAREESVFAAPWSVDDAPADYIDRMLAAIVGIEISITDLQGKWKLSQNRTREDRTGVVKALRGLGNTNMASLVEKAK